LTLLCARLIYLSMNLIKTVPTTYAFLILDALDYQVQNIRELRWFFRQQFERFPARNTAGWQYQLDAEIPARQSDIRRNGPKTNEHD
jgi:hypothetical protein